MNKKFYPLVIFGLIGAYHIATYVVGNEHENKRREKMKEAEAARLERMKSI